MGAEPSTVVSLQGRVIVATWNPEEGVTGVAIRTSDGVVYHADPDGLSLIPYVRAAIVVWGYLSDDDEGNVVIRVTQVTPLTCDQRSRKAS